MIGTQIGRYRIDGELGRGGMGVVYRGTQVTLDRTVAIKMLPAHLADGDNRARFRREALTLARLAHPNIIHIYDVEDQDGHSFIMMEHVGGGSLGDQMASGTPFSPARCVEILAPILSALHAAHLAGIVHRDLKPDNILFTDSGRPKLTDFGVAHMRDGGSKTRTGVMLGTPYYMSPEQAQGKRVTAAADLYAVGVVLYEMLSGHVPFTGEDPLSVALKHVQEAPRPLAELRPDLPAELCALVHRALEKDPTARFHSAAAMQDALESGPWAPGRTTLDPGSSGARAVVPPAPTPGAGETRPWSDGDADDESAEIIPVGATSAVPTAGVSGPGLDADDARSSGRREATPVAAVARAGVDGLGETGRRMAAWLGRPGWRGLPMAFWTGAAALILALGWIGADALAHGEQASSEPERQGAGILPRPRGMDDPSADRAQEASRTAPSAGGGTPVGRLPVSRPSGPSRPDLSDEDRQALQNLARGGTGPDSTPAAGPTPADSAPPTSIIDRLDAGDDDPDVVTLDDLRGRDDEAEPDPAPRAALRSLVDRQIRAVENGNRALFLQDFHPDLRDEAAAEFDAAAASATNIRSTISNLNIEFPESDHAFVTFDVDLTFTVRADGRTERQAYAEAWELRREGSRWWIVEWN